MYDTGLTFGRGGAHQKLSKDIAEGNRIDLAASWYRRAIVWVFPRKVAPEVVEWREMEVQLLDSVGGDVERSDDAFFRNHVQDTVDDGLIDASPLEVIFIRDP